MTPVSTTEPDIRERLIDAAFRLLRDGTGKRLVQTKVAAAAGVLQSHLTYYFPKRADLIAAAARRTIDHLAREVQTLMTSERWPGDGASPERRLMALVSFIVEDKGRSRAVLGLALEALEDESVRSLLIEEVRAARALLSATMGRPTEHPDIDIALAVLQGLAFRHLLRADGDPGQPTRVVLDRLADWLAQGKLIGEGDTSGSE
jgi:AcrR family transcriptional regulator